MTASTRTARLPFDHLIAELAAFPLASEAALANPATHLDPGMSARTAELWRAAEHGLLAAAPGVALDDLVAMRDGLWFADGGRAPRSLQTYLRGIAQLHLEFLGAGVGPRRPPSMSGPIAARPALAQARQSWKWLTLALPEDLLLATQRSGEWVPHAELLTPAVRDLLARGFAETHLHVGASLDFRCVWSLVLARLASPGLRPGELDAPGAALREGRDLPDWLVRAAIARVVLAAFLGSEPRDHLTAYLHGPLCRGRVVAQAGIGTFALVVDALIDLLRGRPSDTERALLQGAYAALVGMRGPTGVDDVPHAWALDPVDVLLGPGAGSPEQRLVAQACAYLDRCESTGRPDVVAAQLLWQAVRVRTIFYRHVTQRPLTPGLPWFIRFYSRMAQARGDVTTALLMEAAAVRSGGPEGLSSLEMRTSPDGATAAMLEWIRTADRLADSWGATRTLVGARPRPAVRGDGRDAGSRHTGGDGRRHRWPETGAVQLGVVFHFVKVRGGEVAPGVPLTGGADTTADPAATAGGYRYGTFYARQRTACVTLARVLHRWPQTLHLVRGLDVCADELAVPSWVFRPLVTYVREAAMAGARHLRGRVHVQPAPLQTTVHAGEDFSHLLTGLRHVDDAAEVLELREGDRIGHGLALGVDPVTWASRVGRVAMPLEDRVFDLAWEWSWWTRRGRGGDGRIDFLEREIGVHTRTWFGRALVPLEVERLARDLADTRQLRAVGFPEGGTGQRARRLERRQRLLLRYLTDRTVFRTGRRTVWVDPTGEVGGLERISASLREEIGRRGLAVEINPTSNLLIGDLGDLENHPLWRISPPNARTPSPRLAVTVGSDDPLVFNSSLPMEYQLLYDALVLAGLTDSDALEWLDSVRRAGLERRFTTHRVDIEDLLAPENQAVLDPPPL